jgi:hypothetical protein
VANELPVMAESLAVDSQSHAPPISSARPSRRRRAQLPVAAAAAAIGVTAAVLLLTGGDAKQSVSGPGYSMQKLAGWSALSQKQLAAAGRPAQAGLVRKGGGVLLIRAKGKAPADFKSFSADLTTALQKRLPDFQKRSSRIIRVGSGQAFFYSYVRRTRGTVHTVTVVPAGKGSYSIDTVTPGGDEQAARQAAQMILSFDAGS